MGLRVQKEVGFLVKTYILLVVGGVQNRRKLLVMGDRPGKNGRKKGASLARKRKHHGNQYTICKRKGGESTTEESTLLIDVIEEEIDDVGDPISASARKIQPIIVPDVF